MKEEKFVRVNTIEGYEDVKDCYWISNSDERRLGIGQANISRCCCGKSKTAGGFHFEFVNKEENENE